MTLAMYAALRDAIENGPLVKGRAGWSPKAFTVGYTTRTIESLVDRRFLVITGNVEKWGAEAAATADGIAWARRG